MDGTRMGAMISHTMGTTNPDDLIRAGSIYRQEGACSAIDGPQLTGMDEEQREWEGHDERCESELIPEAGMWSTCRCKERQDEQ